MRHYNEKKNRIASGFVSQQFRFFSRANKLAVGKIKHTRNK
jgi:hypothetical protein